MCAFSDLRLTVRPRSLAQEQTIGRVSSVMFCREEIVCNPQGLNDCNGYGYFYVRLYWTGFGFQANIVEEYVLLSASLHIFVGLKRTWDQKLSSGVWSGQLNLAITGLMLLTLMTIHLFQFLFADTEQYFCALRQPLSIGTQVG